MAARRQSKVTPKYKTKYRVRNWAAYEKSLCRRGDITIWFDDDAVSSWNAVPSRVLAHLGLPTTGPQPDGARGPPQTDWLAS